MVDICPACENGTLVEQSDGQTLLHSECTNCGEQVVLRHQIAHNDRVYEQLKRKHKMTYEKVLCSECDGVVLYDFSMTLSKKIEKPKRRC